MERDKQKGGKERKKKGRILRIKGAVCVLYFPELAKIQSLRLLQSRSSNLMEYQWIETNTKFKYGGVVFCLQCST